MAGRYGIKEITELRNIYRDGLLNDTLPFWKRYCVDKKYGGFTFCLDRDGSVMDPDKGLWQTGRFTWLLAHLYNTVEKRIEWLELAAHGIDFMRKYAFDDDGRMFFTLTQDGRPLRKRRYVFTETFGAIAFAEYAKAAGDKKAETTARDLFALAAKYMTKPGYIEPKVNRDTRPMQSLGAPMILLTTAQSLREAFNDRSYNEWVDKSIALIRNDFMKPEFRAVLENTGPNGEFIDHCDGRIVTPGHAIEAAWFIMDESRLRSKDAELLAAGLQILDWMWEMGWDKEYGGMRYYRDVKGLPMQEYWHDMKFWWPQNETIIATLSAYRLTGSEKYAKWHSMSHEWAHKYFPDPEYGEWYGYLHRDGRISVRSKGNIWKGPFHLPRMQLRCWQICDEIIAKF